MKKKIHRKIDTKLLSVILKKQVVQNRGCTDKYRPYLYFYVIDVTVESINISELASRCKKWAIKKEYALESLLNMAKSLSVATCQIHYRWEHEEMPCIEADSEEEAILKAGQLVYETEQIKKARQDGRK